MTNNTSYTATYLAIFASIFIGFFAGHYHGVAVTLQDQYVAVSKALEIRK